VPRGVDSLVMSMNKGVKYSLLECPSKYSVRVATFRGNVILDQRKIRDIEDQRSGMKSKLATAAEKAHKLTLALRRQRVEAYEFHDRHESIVAVGSFEWVSAPRRDGKDELNPAVHRIMQVYGPRKQNLPGASGLAGLQPRSLDGIAFDIQPLPVQVPRRSIAADYVQANDTRR